MFSKPMQFGMILSAGFLPNCLGSYTTGSLSEKYQTIGKINDVRRGIINKIRGRAAKQQRDTTITEKILRDVVGKHSQEIYNSSPGKYNQQSIVEASYDEVLQRIDEVPSDEEVTEKTIGQWINYGDCRDRCIPEREEKLQEDVMFWRGICSETKDAIYKKFLKITHQRHNNGSRLDFLKYIREKKVYLDSREFKHFRYIDRKVLCRDVAELLTSPKPPTLTEWKEAHSANKDETMLKFIPNFKNSKGARIFTGIATEGFISKLEEEKDLTRRECLERMIEFLEYGVQTKERVRELFDTTFTHDVILKFEIWILEDLKHVKEVRALKKIVASKEPGEMLICAGLKVQSFITKTIRDVLVTPRDLGSREEYEDAIKHLFKITRDPTVTQDKAVKKLRKWLQDGRRGCRRD